MIDVFMGKYNPEFGATDTMPDTTRIYLECDCGHDVLEVCIMEDGEWDCAEVAFWSTGIPRPSSLWWRIKMAAKILLQGTHFSDQITVSIPRWKAFLKKLAEVTPFEEKGEEVSS